MAARRPLILKKNEAYHDAGNIRIREITARIIADPQIALNMFLNGELDLADLPDSRSIEAAEGQAHLLQQYYDGTTVFLELNLTKPELQSQKIRAALASAINRADFCASVLKSHSQPALALTSPSVRSADGKGLYQSAVGYVLRDNDREAARISLAEGLQEAGLSKLSLTLVCSDDPAEASQAKAIAANLQDSLGIAVLVEPLPAASRIERIGRKDYHLAITGLVPDYNDPLAFLGIFATGHGNNRTGYSSAAFDRLLSEARSESSAKKRQAVCVDMERLLLQDLPVIPIYFKVRDYAVRKDIRGVVRSAFQSLSFRYAYVEG